MASRPQCAVFIAASLDGFIARSDGGLDWLSVVERPSEDYGYRAFFDGVDALVMGRRTYDTVLGFDDWPYTGKRCLVLTHAPASPRADEEFVSGAPAVLLDRLGAEGVRRVYVDGGAVIRQFLAAGLVDELTVSLIPVLLGDGIPLFVGGGDPASLATPIATPATPTRGLRLVSARSFDSGLVQLRYQLGIG
jgi:dihydrofolate reductase